MPLLPCGTEMEDARGMQAEMHAMEQREAHVKAIADAIAHDEQLSLWSEEMQSRPGMQDFLAFLGEDYTYEDGLACHAEFKDAIRDLTESVIERVLAYQQRMAWRPIDTAPKTGSNMVAIPILGLCPDEPTSDKVRVIWWEPKLGGGMWYDDRDIKDIVKPTHWMPLPAPPATLKG